MKPNRSVPPATVVPVLSYPDVRAAVAWLSTAERRGDKAAQDDEMAHYVRVRVEDVSAQFERARAHGARVLEPITDREYGERDCTVADLAGHRWQFA